MTYEAQQHNIQPDPAQNLHIAIRTLTINAGETPHIVFCGGFHSCMNGTKAQFLASVCQRLGWSYTRFDYRGHGQSDGRFEHCDLTDWLTDTLAVIDQIPHRIHIVGSSMGAWLATLAAQQRSEKIAGLITIAAAPDFTEELLWPALTLEQQQQLQQGEAISIATKYEQDPWRVRWPLFQSGRELSILSGEQELQLKCPVRMLHGTADVDVPWQQSQRLLDKLSPATSATLTLIHQGDHRLSDTRSLDLLEQSLTDIYRHHPGCPD